MGNSSLALFLDFRDPLLLRNNIIKIIVIINRRPPAAEITAIRTTLLFDFEEDLTVAPYNYKILYIYNNLPPLKAVLLLPVVTLEVVLLDDIDVPLVEEVLPNEEVEPLDVELLVDSIEVLLVRVDDELLDVEAGNPVVE
jgi:hypothetical protein